MVRSLQVYVVLPPRVLLLDVAGPLEVLRRANQLQSELRFEVRYIAPTAAVQSSIGLDLARVEPLPARLPEGAWLVVCGDVDDPMPGGGTAPAGRTEADTASECALVDWLRGKVRPDILLVCICTGALLAARAGLLDGRACTTHHTSCEELARLAPTARVQENRLYVADGPCYTSAGITAGIDLMLHLVGRLTGSACAMGVARYLVVYLRRGGADPQLSPWLEGRNHLHPALHRVQDAVAADPARDWSVVALARIACVSERHLSRLFNEHVGMGILAYVNRLRIARAGELLGRTQLDMEQVAERTGFGSVRQFRRAWHRVHATPPRAARPAASVEA